MRGIKKPHNKKTQELENDEDWKDIKLRAEISRLKHEGTKTTHDARKVATFDLRMLLSTFFFFFPFPCLDFHHLSAGKYMQLKTKSITWAKLAEQLAENELTIVWPLQGASQYPSDFWDVSSFGMGEWKVLQDSLADGSLELRRWTEGDFLFLFFSFIYF